MTIRVLVVDDHAVVRSGLRRVLDAEKDIKTVAEAANAERAVFEALEHKPDVVLLDVVMPGKSGIEGMPALLQAVPDARILVLSMQDDPRYVREAFEAGARARMPGMWAYQASRLCACWAASWRPPPVAIRTTRGTLICPPDM